MIRLVGAGLAGTMFIRWSRKERHKLKKPEDKSLVVLGKVKLSRPYAQVGVSEKHHPILMSWNKPVRSVPVAVRGRGGGSIQNSEGWCGKR